VRRFTSLYAELDETTKTSAKVDALAEYFAKAPHTDAAWAVRVLSGKALIRRVSGSLLRAWTAEATGLPLWLIAECHDAVGDLSETISLLTNPKPEPATEGTGGELADLSLSEVVEQYVLPLAKLDEEGQRRLIMEAWSRLGPRETFLYHKLLGGSLRVGVSRTLVIRALARVAGVEQAVMAQRTAGPFEPTPARYARLISGADEDSAARPYPFFLAHSLDERHDHLDEALGPLNAWQVEWKWDGIRAQLVRRASDAPAAERVIIWSRSEELLSPAFPELVAAGESLPPDTVLDGELLAWDRDAGRPLPFAALQRRINRKSYEPRLFDDVPVVYIAYDSLEIDGEDLRPQPLTHRRAMLERLIAEAGEDALRLSEIVSTDTWRGLHELVRGARDRGIEGVMLKRRDSTYGVGRTKTADAGGTAWYKWKVDPYTIDAVLTMAQRGSGKRAGLFTDYTFAVWDHDPDARNDITSDDRQLVTVAKAYSGLSNDEIEAVDRWIRNNTVERFGPVNAVKPELVFELGFEGIQKSGRHKAGYALRFPRMLRQRTDKTAAEADSVESVAALFAQHAAGYA